MQVTVRMATEDDVPALAILRWRWHAEGTTDGGPDRDDFTESFTEWFRDHRSTHLAFVAVVDGDLVGVAWLMIAERVPGPTRRRRRCGDVQSVHVVPERRNRGIGASLLAALLRHARTLELEHVTVHSSPRAVPVYRRAGFENDQQWLRWEPDQVCRRFEHVDGYPAGSSSKP